MRLLIAGAGGMLASALERAAGRALPAAHAAVALSIDDVDITDRGATERALVDLRPDAVLNCAAYTDVDGAEAARDAAFAVNADGAGNVAAAAARVGALVLYPSTDYVFDGRKRSPYVESDSPAPLSAYGESKLAGERATAAANPRHLIVRTAWLFGPGGRNFVDTMLALAGERDVLRVVDDQVGCPTYVDHLAEAILGLVAAGTTGAVHAAGSGSCSWYELAREVVRGSGHDCRVDPCTTAEFPRPARRPAYGVLASERPDAPKLPHWSDALAAHLARRGVLVPGARS